MLPPKTFLAILPALATAVSACQGPPVNGNTLNLLKSFEKMAPNAYDDGYGNPTIGYGHVCKTKDCSDVPFPKPLNEDSATKLLQGDLASPQDTVTNALARPVTLNDNQYGALVSWGFNVGGGNVRKSDLVKRMNAGENVARVADDELPQYNKANGKVSNGLVRRRKAEVDLFNAPAKFGALPAPC